MTYLLDTHALLWAGLEPAQLGARARNIVEDSDTVLLISLASCWEMAIKKSLGKLTLRMPLRQFLTTALSNPGYQVAPLELRHTLVVETLPLHHRDPFDRMLVAQALVEGWPMVSRDAVFDSYGVDRVW